MDTLPDDIVLYGIVRRLGCEDVMRGAQVSRQWRALCCDPSALYGLTLVGDSTRMATRLCALAPRCRALKFFEFDGAPIERAPLSRAQFDSVASALCEVGPGVRDLYIQGTGGMSVAVWRHAALHWRDLRTLAAPSATHGTMKLIAQALPEMQRLRCISVDGPRADVALSAAPGSLRNVRLMLPPVAHLERSDQEFFGPAAARFGRSDQWDLAPFARSCPLLDTLVVTARGLDVGPSHRIGQAYVGVLAPLLCRVRVLELHFDVSMVALVDVVRACSRLEGYAFRVRVSSTVADLKHQVLGLFYGLAPPSFVCCDGGRNIPLVLRVTSPNVE
jgi:hypothetical protein